MCVEVVTFENRIGLEWAVWTFIEAMMNSKFMTKRASECQGGRNELKDLLRKKVN